MPGILFPEFYFVLILMIVFSAIALKSKSLNLLGWVFGILVGAYTYFYGGLFSFLILLVFFLVGETATRIGRQLAHSNKHEVRGIANILGNIGPGLVLLFIKPEMASVGFFAVVSAALGDTLSGEIGRLSKQQPLLITTLERVEKGTDGGITFLGLMASILGGLIIGIIYFAMTQNAYLSFLVAAAGLIGSNVDSFLGATLQQYDLLDNNQVNFLAVLITGILMAIASV